MYLPMLQANFAAENRFLAMFSVRKIRQDFQHAPWAWWWAMFATLVLPIPLYLLKIELPPRELIWLPTWFFILLMLPARIACGLALRRARRLPLKTGRWAFVMRWTARLAIPPLVGVYLLFVYLSQYLSWTACRHGSSSTRCWFPCRLSVATKRCSGKPYGAAMMRLGRAVNVA